MKKKTLCMLFTFLLMVMVFTFTPKDAYAMAGNGTESNPYLATNYTDLKTGLSMSGDVYIRLDWDIAEVDELNNNYFDITSGKKVIDLYGYNLERRAITVDSYLFVVEKGATLEFKNSLKKTSTIKRYTINNFGKFL